MDARAPERSKVNNKYVIYIFATPFKKLFVYFMFILYSYWSNTKDFFYQPLTIATEIST